MDNSDIEKMLEMKNVSNEIAGRIAEKYPPLSEEQKKRIISRLDIMNDNNEKQIRVVSENKKKPVFKTAACAAAVLIAAGVGLKLFTDSQTPDGYSIPGTAPETTEAVTEVSGPDYKAENLPYFDVPPIKIPENIEGLTEKEAADLIRSMNMDKEYDLVTRYVLSETLEKGLAVKAEFGATGVTDTDGNNYCSYSVFLYISSGKLNDSMDTEIPVTDNSLTGHQSQDILEENGFNVQVRIVYDEIIPEGYTVKTDPPAGTKAEYGSTVVLYVSRGNMISMVTLPDAEGMTEST